MSFSEHDEREHLQTKMYNERAGNFVELHDQVQNSLGLLDSLETFLATFQNDLSAVSGQIFDLQTRSKDFDSRLKSRRKIEKPLSELLSELCIRPALAAVILDTEVGETWLPAIAELEKKLQSRNSRMRVKAARDLSDVMEGLRIVAATKIRAFFLTLMGPIRTSITTNMQVLQTSVFLKYRAFFGFLQHHAAPVAQEIQRAYVGAARLYYETGFRRYTRSLGWIKARHVDKAELIGNVAATQVPNGEVDLERLSQAGLDGPGVTLAYMADDKNHKQPTEALFRAMLLVLLDNASAEYNFILRFFQEDQMPPLPTPRTPLTPLTPAFGDDTRTDVGSEFGAQSQQGGSYISSADLARSRSVEGAELSMLGGLWKQVMEPAIQFCQAFANSTLEPTPPPVVPLFTMIRCNESVLAELQVRGCAPLEGFCLALRMSMWPAFQNEMNNHVDSLKRLADGATGGILSRGVIKEGTIQLVSNCYVVMFTSFVVLTDGADEPMLFSNLVRLRQELTRLITTQAAKIKGAAQSAAYLSTTYEDLLKQLSVGPRPNTHGKAQTEIAYWREREEEARRRIASARR